MLHRWPCYHPNWSAQTSCPCRTTACSPGSHETKMWHHQTKAKEHRKNGNQIFRWMVFQSNRVVYHHFLHSNSQHLVSRSSGQTPVTQVGYHTTSLQTTWGLTTWCWSLNKNISISGLTPKRNSCLLAFHPRSGNSKQNLCTRQYGCSEIQLQIHKNQEAE